MISWYVDKLIIKFNLIYDINLSYIIFLGIEIKIVKIELNLI